MKKATKFLVPLIMGLLIVASIVWYLFIYDRAFTRDMLLEQARFQDMHGNSRISSWFYDAAYDFSGHDDNVAIELANQYKADGNYTKAELTLTRAIASNPSAEGYAALCKTYVEQDKLMDAVNMLDSIGDPLIRDQLRAMRPYAPSADYAAGYYSQYMDIHLSSTADTIYYSTDGTYPSINGMRYEECISLPAGQTTVHAIAVDENGLVSPITVLGYTITGVIEEVTFTDPAMDAAIRSLIGADAGDTVFTNALWGITEFTAPEGVGSYEDVARMPYLKKLTIHGSNLGSLDFLSSLASLEELDLTGCSFPAEELAQLASLPALSHLTLADCSLSTIADLANAQNLRYLNLSQNTVRNLEVLAPMTTLREINLEHNAVTDLSALGSLINLEKLNVAFNSITSLAPLASCTKLNSLDAGNNQIANLNGVDKLTLLSYLSVEYNKLTNVSILAGCTELTNLSIASNSITDITSLKDLTNLEIFDFSSNQIAALPIWPEGCALQTIDGSYNLLTSIDGLKKMQSMTHVYMDYNLLTNIDSLADCFCLVQVNVFGNKIPDVSKLRDHDIIVNYDPTLAAE
nr:leucine-rich repeat domain-containing protein [Oscillospiraceae bacterium]